MKKEDKILGDLKNAGEDIDSLKKENEDLKKRFERE